MTRLHSGPHVAFLRLGIPRWTGHLRVAHLSALYVGAATPLDLQVAAVGLVNEAQPDLTVLTGNFVTRGRRYLDRLTGTLLGLESPAVAVLGQSDRLAGAAAVATALERAGVTVLEDDWTPYGISAETVALPGGLLLGVTGSPEAAPLLWARGAPLVLAGSSGARAFPDGWSSSNGGQVYAHPGLGTPGIHRPARRHVAILDLVGISAATAPPAEPVARPWDFAA